MNIDIIEGLETSLKIEISKNNTYDENYILRKFDPDGLLKLVYRYNRFEKINYWLLDLFIKSETEEVLFGAERIEFIVKKFPILLERIEIRDFLINCDHDNDLLKMLLQKYEIEGDYVFLICKNNNTELLRFLFEQCKNKKLKINYLCLFYASGNNNNEIIKMLVSKFGKKLPYTPCVIKNLCYCKNKEMIDLLIENYGLKFKKEIEKIEVYKKYKKEVMSKGSDE